MLEHLTGDSDNILEVWSVVNKGVEIEVWRNGIEGGGRSLGRHNETDEQMRMIYVLITLLCRK